MTVAVVDAEGVAHMHQRPHTRQLTTIFGEISLRRIGYGGRGLASLHPLDAALNLPPETYSHTLRQRVASAAASQSYDQVVALLSEQIFRGALTTTSSTPAARKSGRLPPQNLGHKGYYMARSCAGVFGFPFPFPFTFGTGAGLASMITISR